MICVRFPLFHLTAQFFLNNLFVYFPLVFNDFFIDLDGYFIVRTDEGQPRPKYILINVELTSTFFSLQEFGPSLHFNSSGTLMDPINFL